MEFIKIFSYRKLGFPGFRVACLRVRGHFDSTLACDGRRDGQTATGQPIRASTRFSDPGGMQG